uniref:Uncharacterized protein n=1 Tax=Romanomermis culicivorax TaxID=13658 RepID=A0A915J523_ROMCU
MLLHQLYDILSPMEKPMTQLQADSFHPFDAEKKTKLVITQLEQICLSEAPLSGASFISLCNNVEQKKIRTSDVWTRAIREECDIKAKNLVRIIIANLNNRMWNNNQVIESFKIFDSDGIKSIEGCALLEYGHTSLERLILHYKHVENLDEIAIKLEWEYYKFQYLKPLSENDDQDENFDDEAYNCFMEIAEKGF